ncbi:MAG: glycerol-3-phosphate acyltransferase [Tildeniella nuda ZEHNDER 1965/U140]|jgi:pyruvate,water dikinase|nr:glycerol-3-phosphate acyltransferase [Tildeniella nuda ZEHNDER 1965/U140]
MTLTQVWGALLLFIVCPLLGGLPLIAWITYALTQRSLATLGTGNISVSAAFYHGGRVVGILAVLSEALKGIAAVLLARSFFPSDPVWELVALIALVVGRYWFGKGAGTTNVVWGYVVHDPIAAGFVFLISGISFTILRERRQGRLSVLVIFPLMTALRHPLDQELIGAAIILSVVLGWIYTKLPDDLDLPSTSAQADTQSTFKFFRRDRAIRSLSDPLDARKVGQKAATLARLKRSGYPVPMGWVLSPGDDPEPLVELLKPTPKAPLIVRSSAVGEDSETASAAGQYESISSIIRREQLLPAISRCFASYNESGAVQYRRDRTLPDAAMSVLIQQQVRGVFSGVAFSRDPVTRQGDTVAIEALPGSASQVVSGQVTPESYQVIVPAIDVQPTTGSAKADWVLLDDHTFTVNGIGTVPLRLIQQVAFLTRHLEAQHQGIPQDIEWSYDGQQLWLLQARPITTLLPIWTRKIAAEVIPGLIHPLTWSINRPLTCGVWGDLFTLVLRDRARGLDFNETATLHYSHAYFNASLLGQLFRRMGLPPESLEFLTRGARFSKPPLQATLRNVPGLLRLASREWRLEKDFRHDHRRHFAPALAEFSQQPASDLSPVAILKRIDRLLNLLQTATYYSILAPLSAALRKAIFKVKDEQLDNSDTPEIAALRSLQELAQAAREVLERESGVNVSSSTSEAGDGSVERNRESGEAAEVGEAGEAAEARRRQNVSTPHSPLPTPLTLLAQTFEGQTILAQFDALMEQYGYLSEVGTDIAVPTWREDPQPVRSLFVQFCEHPPAIASPIDRQSGNVKRVQRRLALKGRVTEVYSRLLAELRWSFVALEQNWLESEKLVATGDIFFLELVEIRRLVERGEETHVRALVEQRRSQLEADRALEIVPFLVYGNDPPTPIMSVHNWQSSQQLRGIGASPGQAEGIVKVVRSLTALPEIDRDTILVVPYTDSGWAPLLARAGGLIAEVGGRLSHGAIVAREYRIPAVMDIHNATQLLQDGQRVRIDGQQGTVEIV